MIPVESCIGVFVKIFVLLTPFFILSVFISMTGEMEPLQRRALAKRTTVAIWVICMVIYLFGERIFHYLGITPEAFQAGTGVLLLLSGIELVRGTSTSSIRSSCGSNDIAVVPLAIPYTVGPGTVGTLLVMGATASDWKMRGIELAGITAAVLLIGLLLIFCERMEAILKKQGLEILTKLTGLFLAALAAQLILSALRTIIHTAS